MDQIVQKVTSLKKRVETEAQNPSFESLKDIMSQLFLTGRNIWESKNIKFT